MIHLRKNIKVMIWMLNLICITISGKVLPPKKFGIDLALDFNVWKSLGQYPWSTCWDFTFWDKEKVRDKAFIQRKTWLRWGLWTDDYTMFLSATTKWVILSPGNLVYTDQFCMFSDNTSMFVIVVILANPSLPNSTKLKIATKFSSKDIEPCWNEEFHPI